MLIYNPAAGKLGRNPESTLQRTTAALARGGLEPRLLPTSGAGQAGQLAREAIAAGADLILVFGGDGTINEAAQGVVHSGVPMGILPGGTANVLAVELGLGLDPEKAAQRLAECEPAPIAVGRVTGPSGEPRYFLLMFGAGLDATVVYEVHAGLKRATGKLAYWMAGLSRLAGSIPQLEVRVNGGSKRCGYLLLSRVRNYGGDLEIAAGASLRRDDFEAVLFEGTNPLRYAWYMLGVAARRIHSMRGVSITHVERAELLTGAPSQIDGEFIGDDRYTVEIVPRALNLLLPPSYG